MRVLCTGGSGYVGSVITARLIEAGHEVAVYDLDPGGADIRDRAVLASALDVADADAVIHCAARTLVPESFTDPAAYWDVNLGGTLALLEAMRETGVGRVVFSSTAAVYGEPENVPIGEDHRALPVTPYGASKLACDTLLAGYARLHGFAAASLRYFNVAGAHRHDGKRLGERHDPETHLIPNVLAAAAAGRPVQVCGDDYPTPDGTCIRDYIHVTDIADAHLLALEASRPGQYKAWNIGRGAGFTVRQVIQACREVTGLDIKEETVPRRPGDPAVLVASPARARAELGWQPSRGLHAIVADAWAFMQQDRQATQ